MTPEELKRRLKLINAFMEGISYALPEEAGHKLRSRIVNGWDNIREFLDFHFPSSGEKKDESADN